MKETITLDCYGIVIEMDKKSPEDHWGGTISSNLKCSPIIGEGYDEEVKAMEYNLMMDALESIILSHACAGIDVTTPAYLEGIETACNTCAKATE